MSLLASSLHDTLPHSPHDHDTISLFATTTSNNNSYYYPSPPYSAPVTEHEFDSAAFLQALALTQQSEVGHCMHKYYNFDSTNPGFALQQHTANPGGVATPPPPAAYGANAVDVGHLLYGDWTLHRGMGGPAVPPQPQGLKRGRTHTRTPSASTVASNGPASPYTHNFGHPHIANTDFAPNSPAHVADAAYGAFSKNLPSALQLHEHSAYFGGAGGASGDLSSPAAHTGAAHQALKGFLIDFHNREIGAEPARSSHTMSSNGNDSPATPLSAVGDVASNAFQTVPQNDAPVNPNVQLWRTESQAYQDELYNPPATSSTYAAPPPPPPPSSKSANNFLSPHRNLVTERLQTANFARSQSPISAVSRERSPFRDGSLLAPAAGWSSPGAAVGTAASLRQQQKEQSDQAELSQHRPQLHREPTKTISPKDALLDYHESEPPSLFRDSIPPGYKQHTGGTEHWPSNFFSQPGSAFGSLPTSSQQPYATFRAIPSADGLSGGGDSSTLPGLPQTSQGSLQNGHYFDSSYAAAKMEPTPEFPAQLMTMESSLSDTGAPLSSQESIPNTSAPSRPADTRAATGTYTCTYHGCTERFDSPANLQKHKRDVHRSHQHHRDGSGTVSSATPSTSPRSTESPAPGGSGMTSAALAARNSQAGPHKCNRINPSTGKPCNTVFSRPYDLTRHEDTIHNNRKQKVRCPMCREEKTFSRNDALTRHMRVVHPEMEDFSGKRKRTRE